MPVTVTVPATTANLGSGFDCLGAALSIYNRFTFTDRGDEADKLQIIVRGAEADRVDTGADNMIYQAFCRLYAEIDRPVPAVTIEIDLGVALSRGLGSSATAIVGGIVGANELAGRPLNTTALGNLATAIEGHPDNVIPALMGGFRLAVADGDQWIVCALPWNEAIVPVVAIPDFELSTAESRRVLPETYSRSDAAFNAAHVSLLVQGLAAGNGDWVRVGIDDRLHQSYRVALIAGYRAVEAAAIAAGAYGVAISGAGPTMLALCAPETVEAVMTAMDRTWRTEGITPDVRSVQLDYRGVQVESTVV
ncbi:MAG: homoserine kinase [Oscillatoriales cyanobacterium]|nr:MAG: homoserine kinase [Oscillatoriales cyanobacterium]